MAEGIATDIRALANTTPETRQPETTWQDISTAQKDGTPILACRDNGCGWDYVVVWWSPGDEHYPWCSESGASYPADRFDVWTSLIDPPARIANLDREDGR